MRKSEFYYLYNNFIGQGPRYIKMRSRLMVLAGCSSIHVLLEDTHANGLVAFLFMCSTMTDGHEKVFKLLFPVREGHCFCLSMHFM